MAKPLLYRIEEIPEDLCVSKDDIVQLFIPEYRRQVKVTSLSRAPDWNEENRNLVATALFSPSNDFNKPELKNAQCVVDSDFYGFTPWYTPEGEIEADIVALTGLAGHAYGSWAVSTEKMWLRDFLPSDFSKCRVLTYGYDSRLEADESRGILNDHTNNFAVKLQDMRRQNQCVDRPVVCIGHSLGCLVIKDALINFHSFRDKKKVEIPPVICLVLIGAPHRGLEVTSLQTLVKGRPSEDLISELKKGSPTLTRLNTDFKNLYGDLNILTIYEMKDTSSVRQLPDGSWDKDGPLITMVEKDSAILYWEKEQLLGLNQDHRQIARINRGQSGCYNQIRGFIKSSLEQRSRKFASAVSSERVVQSSTDPHRDNKPEDEFFLAVRNGASTQIRNMLKDGMQIDCHRGDHHRPLHTAAEWASADIVQLLLSSGADPDAPNTDGWAPIHFVCRFNSAATLGVLLRATADAFCVTAKDQCTPLHLAARYNKSSDMLSKLIDLGADVNAKEVDGWTPLHLAVRYGNRLDVIRLLLIAGADVNAVNDEGYTALHLAAGNSTSAILELILVAGCDVNARDVDGWTALHWAVRHGQNSNLDRLLRWGADREAITIAGTSPIDVGFTDVVTEAMKDSIRDTWKSNGSKTS